MRELEIAVLKFLLEIRKKDCYHEGEYLLLHKTKYERNMPREAVLKLREEYRFNPPKAALELKTYYKENGILSNTITLKLRPKANENELADLIQVKSEIDGKTYQYVFHDIEVFKEDGKYKVFDVMHRDKVMWLETYLDELCEVNSCPRERLRYDLGYLISYNALADNMGGLSDLMRYLDKVYQIGKPRINLVNIELPKEEWILFSDDLAIDFSYFSRSFGVSLEEVITTFQHIYDSLFTIQFNLLHCLCMAKLMYNPLIEFQIRESIFNMERICELL